MVDPNALLVVLCRVMQINECAIAVFAAQTHSNNMLYSAEYILWCVVISTEQA